jgi:capsular polysaccharide transport system ATP-binding protein
VISLEGVGIGFGGAGGGRRLFDGLDLCLPAGARVALLGANGAGKSTLLSIIAGTLRPDRGRVRRTGRVSWPVGFAGGLAPDMTGAQNARFVARIHGADPRGTVAFVEEFAELGRQIDDPVRTYSAGMRARLAFGLSMAMDFDWYLADEVTSVGDAAFRRRSIGMSRGRLDHAGLVIVSHALPVLRELCTCGIVLAGGRATFHDDLETAIAAHEGNPSVLPARADAAA